MTRVGFFGHNVHDAAVRRRALAFLKAGVEVTGFMMRRGEPTATEWQTVDLGFTRDYAYHERLKAIVVGARRAAASGALAAVDLVYARNLDMLATAHLALALAGLRRPVVFECLDIHRRLTSGGPAALALSTLERALMRRTDLLVVSSPAFLRHYFAPRYGEGLPSLLVENRLIEGGAFGPRPSGPTRADGPLGLGWFGNLRCARSFEALKAVARRHGEAIEIHLAGYTTPGVFRDFEGDVARHANMRFTGRFRAPEDLGTLYGGVDLVWAGDFYEEGANSTWLLPNRLYEGGHFGVPAIAPAGTETARHIEARGTGFVVDEPLEENLTALVGALAEDRARVAAAGARLLALPRESFVEPAGFAREIVSAALAAREATPLGARASA